SDLGVSLLSQRYDDRLDREVVVAQAVDVQALLAILREQVADAVLLEHADVTAEVAERSLRPDVTVGPLGPLGDRISHAGVRVVGRLDVQEHDPHAVGTLQRLRALDDAIAGEVALARLQGGPLEAPLGEVVGGIAGHSRERRPGGLVFAPREPARADALHPDAVQLGDPAAVVEDLGPRTDHAEAPEANAPPVGPLNG